MNDYNPHYHRNKPVIPHRNQGGQPITEKPFSHELLAVVEALAEYGKAILEARIESSGDLAKTDEETPFDAAEIAVPEILTKEKNESGGYYVKINC